MRAVRYRSTMSSSDAIIWHIERNPSLRSTVTGVWELDGTPDTEMLLDSLERMVVAIPRLRQRVDGSNARPNWTDVGTLDLADHFSVHALAEGAAHADVMAFAQTWVTEPFASGRPLWRLALLTGLADGRSAIVIQIHHAIADGVGFVLMLAAFTDMERCPTQRPSLDGLVEPEGRRAFSPVHRALHRIRPAAANLVKSPTRESARLVAVARSTTKLVWPSRRPYSTVMTGRSGSFRFETRQLPLAAMREVARSAGVSVNDVFVAVVADATARYHARHGAVCDRLRLHMPINVRTARTATLAGNQFVPARATLDIPQPGSAGRLVSIHEQLETLRGEPALGHVNTVSAMLLRLGVPVARWVIGGMMQGVDVLASNVPGPSFPIYLAGSEIQTFTAFGPTAGASLNITLFSYRGTVNLGVTLDAAAVPDGDAFLECLDAALAALPGVPAVVSA